MKDFVARLGLLIHWIGFLGSMLIALFLFYSLIQEGEPPNVSSSALILIAFIGSNTLGWVLRWLIVGGNIKFLPFIKD